MVFGIFWYGCNFLCHCVFVFPQVHFWFQIPLTSPEALPKNLSSFSVCPCRRSLKIRSKSLVFCHFWFRRFDTQLFPLRPFLLLCHWFIFPEREELQERHLSHAASSPSVWIDKDFWFQSSPFSPLLPLSLLSLPLSSLSFCVFLASKDRERERD